jgi:hypothetical protein
MIPAPEHGFKYYTLHYLNLWISQDRPCHQALAGKSREKQLKELANAATKYGIARTLPKRHYTDKGSQRFGPALNIINRQKREDYRRGKASARINRVSYQIKRAYGADHRVLSLTTKFLWLKMQSPIIIYDRRARKALRAPSGDIEAYYKLWHKEFESH